MFNFLDICKSIFWEKNANATKKCEGELLLAIPLHIVSASLSACWPIVDSVRSASLAFESLPLTTRKTTKA